jgi:phosphate transport system substrate-binding protein
MKAINDGKYPSPPARELFFVSAGKPSGALVISFLQWVLGEGQKYVNEAGYVAIKPEKIREETEKLK